MPHAIHHLLRANHGRLVLMETIALLCNVVGRGRDLLPKEDLRAFHKCLMTAMFGAKLQYPNSELPQATNVLTLISKLEKSFQGSERFYLSLCEVAHPNVDGLMFFGDVREAKFELATTTLEENVDFFVRRLAAGGVMTGVAAFWSIRCDREIKPAVIALEKKHGPHPSNWPA